MQAGYAAYGGYANYGQPVPQPAPQAATYSAYPATYPTQVLKSLNIFGKRVGDAFLLNNWPH